MDIKDLDMLYFFHDTHAGKNTENMAKSTQCLSMKVNIARPSSVGTDDAIGSKLGF